MSLDHAIQQIRDDHRSGAVELASRAADLLITFCNSRPAADERQFRYELAALCRRLMAAQPSMASLVSLCNEVMHATERETTIYVQGSPQRATVPQAASNAALRFSTFLAHRSRRIANDVLPFIHSGALLLTHSSSSTVLAALLRARAAGKRFSVVCTESRPQFEGALMARRLAAAGIAVEVVVDAAAAVFLHAFYTLLIGADAISRDGVINKVGTLGMALAARNLGVPVYCLAGSEKFLPSDARFEIEEKHPDDLVAPQPNLRGFNIYFDQTPLELIMRFFTENGPLTSSEVAESCARLHLNPLLAADSGANATDRD